MADHDAQKADLCKHCGLRLDGDLHAEGQQRGKMRCAVDPYGFNAEPVGTDCSRICNGSMGREPAVVYDVEGRPTSPSAKRGDAE